MLAAKYPTGVYGAYLPNRTPASFRIANFHTVFIPPHKRFLRRQRTEKKSKITNKRLVTIAGTETIDRPTFPSSRCPPPPLEENTDGALGNGSAPNCLSAEAEGNYSLISLLLINAAALCACAVQVNNNDKRKYLGVRVKRVKRRLDAAAAASRVTNMLLLLVVVMMMMMLMLVRAQPDLEP